jgi:methylglutaconyl-CoA hydratase
MILIKSEPSPGIVLLTMNRPDKRNALNVELLRALHSAIQEASTAPEQRVLILNGAGPVFCAGLDLSEANDPEKLEESAALVKSTLLGLSNCPLITIATVHGAAMAGGAGIMSACDFVLSTETCLFGYPEVKRGLVAAIVMKFLMTQVSDRHARELLLLSRTINAKRAEQIGLINGITPDEELINEAIKMALEAMEGAPKALKMTKQLLNKLNPPTVNDSLDIASSSHQEARFSDEAREGSMAFLEKRAPSWSPKARENV